MILKPLENDTRIRNDHNTLGAILGYLSTSDRISGTEVFTAAVGYIYQGKVIQNVGDKWLLVVAVNGVPRSGWVAITHKGVPICEEVSEQPTVTLTHTIQVYSDGSIRVDGNPYP